MHHLCLLCVFQSFTCWIFLAIIHSVLLSRTISFDKALCLSVRERERPHVCPVSASVTMRKSAPVLFDDSVSFLLVVHAYGQSSPN